MKKIIFCSIVLPGFIVTAYSQQIQFGAQAGTNFSGASAKNDNEKFKGTPLPGFEAGVFAEVPLAEKWFFHPQAFFFLRGL